MKKVSPNPVVYFFVTCKATFPFFGLLKKQEQTSTKSNPGVPQGLPNEIIMLYKHRCL